MFVLYKLDHVNVTLSIYSTATNVSFVETIITFYNCSQHISYVQALTYWKSIS